MSPEMRTLTLNVVGMMIAIVLTSLSFVITWYVFRLDVKPSTVEYFAVWTSYVCTFLCVFQSRWNYYWGIVTVGLYAWLFYEWQLYASAATQIYLSGALLYGWLRWGPDTATRRVTFVEPRFYLLYAAVTAAVWAGAVWLTSSIGGELPPMDSAILALTILAQFLLDNKKLETWFVWVAVNVVSIILYWKSGLYLVVIQYVFFLANTMWGAYEWRRSMLTDKVDNGVRIKMYEDFI